MLHKLKDLPGLSGKSDPAKRIGRQKLQLAWSKIITFFILGAIVAFSFSCGSQKQGYKFLNKKKIKIALVVAGPINDSSWNEAAYNGLKRFQSEHKVDIAVVEKVNLVDSRKVFSRLADRKFDLIIGHGYEYGYVLRKIVRKYPDTFFCCLGGEIALEPNLCSFKFKDEQYGYLIGLIAGLNTSTNKVGIVVGKKIPSVEKTIIGMRKGLKSVNPKADLVVSYINSWNDIGKGREAGIEQINTGVDVITHLADLSGIGVIKAAEESDISVIGAISDQHDIAPSTVITSGIEDASQLIYLACQSYLEKTLEPRLYSFGLKDQVIDLTPSYGNIDPSTETKINRLKDQLVNLETAQEEILENTRKQRK